MKVIVLGAGVIGTTSAYFLAKAGHQVTVIEKAPSAGMGCSYANGGQLSYSHIETWASHSSIKSLAKAAILPNSFLSIRDFKNIKFLRWVFKFYKNSFTSKAQENSQKLFELSLYSKKVLEQILREENNIKFDYENNGILHFYRTKKAFDEALRNAESYKRAGYKIEILNDEECIKKEPTLVKLFDEKKLAGGIFYEIDASGNSFMFIKSLEKICREKYGVIFEYNAEVKNILTNHKKVTGINTSRGVFCGNKYVYALGAYGETLLNGIEISSDIYPIKGYSLSIAADKDFIAPNIAITDSENRIVYSRIGNVFRVAGTVEINGLKNNKNNKHFNFLSNAVRSTFSDFGNFNDVEKWFGFRPFRPNSIPLICEVQKYGNLLINAGHGSLGWTLSAASGKIIADLVSNKKDDRFQFLEEEEKTIYKV